MGEALLEQPYAKEMISAARDDLPFGGRMRD
jgi:hypothetical protein